MGGAKNKDLYWFLWVEKNVQERVATFPFFFLLFLFPFRLPFLSFSSSRRRREGIEEDRRKMKRKRGKDAREEKGKAKNGSGGWVNTLGAQTRTSIRRCTTA